MTYLRKPMVPVSWGELLDKITILEIKTQQIHRPNACANVAKEYLLLKDIAGPAMDENGISPLLQQLRDVNRALWTIEDAIREQEAKARFDLEFIELARSVYKRNDVRASIKRQINLCLGSELLEEKSYRG